MQKIQLSCLWLNIKFWNSKISCVKINFHDIECDCHIFVTEHTILGTIQASTAQQISKISKFSHFVFNSSFSSSGHLGLQLDKYLHSLPKVVLLRLPKREGIVGARLRGAGLALGDILVFLDSHCEVNYGWLEPLLARIAEDQRHVVTPDIEVINYKTFEYAKKTDPSVGVFNWEMLFKWRKITDDEKRRGNDALPLRLVTRTDMVIDAVCNIKVINEN